MRTSLNEIKLIDQYLTRVITPEYRSVVEARLIADESFRLNVFLQKKIFQLLRLYSRKRVRLEAEKFHEDLFNNPGKMAYKKEILSLFK